MAAGSAWGFEVDSPDALDCGAVGDRESDSPDAFKRRTTGRRNDGTTGRRNGTNKTDTGKTDPRKDRRRGMGGPFRQKSKFSLEIGTRSRSLRSSPERHRVRWGAKSRRSCPVLAIPSFPCPVDRRSVVRPFRPIPSFRRPVVRPFRPFAPFRRSVVPSFRRPVVRPFRPIPSFRRSVVPSSRRSSFPTDARRPQIPRPSTAHFHSPIPPIPIPFNFERPRPYKGKVRNLLTKDDA
ncbi:hypothetical protein BH09MYX1_BH09MYX1_24840 [soil metagenome]